MMTTPATSRPAHVPPEREVDVDVWNPHGVEQGFHEAWLSLQAAGVPELIWTPRNGGHWIVTSGSLIDQIYADHERFSSRFHLVPKFETDDQGKEVRHLIPTHIDPPEHGPYRMILNRCFSPKVVAAMEEMIRRQAGELIDRVVARGRCDFNADYADELPIRVFMGMVGLPCADAPQVKAWCEEVTRPDSSLTLEEGQARAANAMAKLHGYLKPYVAERQGGDGQDVISLIINSKVDDRALTPQEMLDMCTQVMFGGLDTVVNLLGFIMLFMARSSEHRRALVADPALIPAAVNELIRRFPLITIGREIRFDMELDGVQVKQGEMIIAPTALSGLDPRRNPAPLTVDFQRRAMKHATFGKGPHLCPGAFLARAEVRITLEEWLARIPEFEVASDVRISFRGGTVGAFNSPLELRWSV